jgi:hypothetical protein
VADVGRITELWRAAADALENPRDPLHGWEAAEIENARLLAECGRLREQLDAANRMIWTLFERAQFDAHDRDWARGVAEAARRAALGVEGRDE